jgi:hypothetical protein
MKLPGGNHAGRKSGMFASEHATGIEPSNSAAQAEEREAVQASIKVGSVAQIVVAIVAVLGSAYLLKEVTTLSRVLLAFVTLAHGCAN